VIDLVIVLAFILLVLAPCLVAIVISRKGDAVVAEGEPSVTDARPATRLKSTIRPGARPPLRPVD
jgi:hypothetical protein